MKLTILGGGGFRTPHVWEALIRETGTPRITDVVLHDLDPHRLAAMEAVLGSLAVGYDAPSLRTTTDLRSALEGADFVFAALRVDGVDGRCCDEHVALDLGVLGQETTGPGGLAYALRTIPVMRHVAEVMNEVASPRAYLINFTNPAGIITQALQEILGDRVLGICDTPSGLGRRVATTLGRPAGRIEMDYVGLNHLGWMRRVLVDGEDLLPQLLADDAALARMEEARSSARGCCARSARSPTSTCTTTTRTRKPSRRSARVGDDARRLPAPHAGRVLRHRAGPARPRGLLAAGRRCERSVLHGGRRRAVSRATRTRTRTSTATTTTPRTRATRASRCASCTRSAATPPRR